jgi:translation initiation factor 2 subunit 1
MIGELVVATTRKIESYGAYVLLDEYNREGLLHISEMSSRWVRNIRNHVREGQKVVLQVLRVDQSKGHIDLSLRRVTKDERRKKVEDWKKTRKAETLFKSAASTLNLEVEELYQKAGLILVERYYSLYAGLEAVAKEGIEVLNKLGIPKHIAEILAEIAREKISIKGVTIHGVFEITSVDPKGIELIKETLLGTKKIAKVNDAEVDLYIVGAPMYRIEVTADDYKKAEAALEKIVDEARVSWSDQDGEFSFSRD